LSKRGGESTDSADDFLEWTTDWEVNGYHVLLTASDGMAHATKGEQDDIFSMQNLRKKERPEG
jgi:hypothetical protein